MHGSLTTALAIASAAMVSSTVMAESVSTPSSLRTIQISAGVEHESLADFALETFTASSANSEWIGAQISDGGLQAGLSVETRGSQSEYADRISFTFSNNIGPNTLAWGEVMFSTSRSGILSLEEVMPEHVAFAGDYSAEISAIKDGIRIADIVETGQTTELRANAQYWIRFHLDGNTMMNDHTAAWNFNVQYAQAHAVPGIGGLAALLGLGLTRRRHR